MSCRFIREAMFFTLISLTLQVSDSPASQPPIRFPDGRIAPGGSCGTGVTSRSERTAILTRWLVAPAVTGALSLASALVIRRRLRLVVDQRRRTRSAVLVGVLGAVALTLGLYVIVVGGLHAFGVFSLYEPMY